MLRFLKAEVVKWKVGKALYDTDVKVEGSQLPLESIFVGVNVEALLKKCSEYSWKQYQKEIKEALIKIATYFQSRLPLNNSFLKDMICLHALQRTKVSANPISTIAKLMPHVIPSSKILSIVDEWSVLRSDDHVLEDWYLNQDGTFKRLDYHWSKMFSLKTLCGSPRYPLLYIAVKTCYSLQSGNAAVERSLSDNKNTFGKERTSLVEETLKAPRLSKEFVRRNDGVHKVIVALEMRNSIRDTYNKNKTSKRSEW